MATSTNPYIRYYNSGELTLPNADQVRSGVTYGVNEEFTGTAMFTGPGSTATRATGYLGYHGLYVPEAVDVAEGVDNGLGTIGTATVLVSNTTLPDASDVRFGVDRGDGVLGTLIDYSQPTPEDSVIELVHYDEYGTGAISHPKLTWTVATDYTGYDVALIFFKVADDGSLTSYGQKTGAVDSATQVSVSMSATFEETLTFEDCNDVFEMRFRLVIHDGSTQKTIQEGNAYVSPRPLVV